MAFWNQQSALWRIAAWSLLVLFVAALGHHALPLPDHGHCSEEICGPLVPQFGDRECGLCVLLGCLTLFVGLFFFRQWLRPFVLSVQDVQALILPPIPREPGLPRAPPLLLP